MTFYDKLLASLSALALTACSGETSKTPDTSLPTNGSADRNPSAETRPSGQPSLMTVEGRIGDGVECSIITTPDGDVWSFNMGAADFSTGEYVRITGEIADASYCQQGRGTLIVERIDQIEPPARDRDPARAGGIKLSESYVTGSWTGKGVNANCDKPDFQIRKSAGGLVIESSVNDVPTDARIVLGNYPRIDLGEPLPDLPLESRGPDGIAVLRPATDAQYDPVTIGGHTIEGDGVVFVKCG